MRSQYEVEINGRLRQVSIRQADDRFAVTIDGRESTVDARGIDAYTLSLLVSKPVGQPKPDQTRGVSAGSGFSRTFSHEVTVARDPATGRLTRGRRSGRWLSVLLNGRRRWGRKEESAHAAGGAPERVVAPMPGKVVRVLVKAGQVVRARQPMVVIEAMKMENELRASARRHGFGAPGEGRPVGGGWRASGHHRGGFRVQVRNNVLRYVSLALMLAIAILAATVVSTLTVDIGPYFRGLVESEGSKALKRPIHIGALKVHVLSGRVLVEDFSIGGLQPTDRPFFTAKRLSVSVDWSTALRRRPEFTITSVELTDWQMLVEKRGDRHSFPKFTRDRDLNEPERPSRFKTTLKYVRAWRGRFAYEDQGAPWSIVAPNIDLNISNVPTYHGEATFTGGTIAIQRLRADVGEHESTVFHRRQPAACAEDRVRNRRCEKRSRRRGRFQSLA